MRISGTGAWVVDIICDVKPSENNPSVGRYFASEDNPHGIIRGAATRKADIERRFSKECDQILKEIAVPGSIKKTLGGVAAATLIGASQMLAESGADVYFYTQVGDDDDGRLILDQFRRTPIKLDKVRVKKAKCRSSIILNESLAAGRGQERSFLSECDAGEDLMLGVDALDEDFYASDIAFFASLFWEPRIKRDLTRILRTCKERGAVTVIGASSDPNLQDVKGRWELGDREEMYRYLDLLIMDKAEAMAYSGKAGFDDALDYFKEAGVKSLLVTDGLEPTYYYSDGSVFRAETGRLPIATPIVRDKESGLLPTGDTVGCGDNFAGGAIASLAAQMSAGKRPSIKEATILGNLCGAFASSYSGGTYYEKKSGEKKKKIDTYMKPYLTALCDTNQ